MYYRYLTIATAALLLAVAAAPAAAQIAENDVFDFEDFDLPSRGYLNNATAIGVGNVGEFSTGGAVAFPNTYTEEFDSWTGWAISERTDTSTAGFQNQYSTYAGTGAEGTATFGVAFSDTRINSNVADAVPAITELYVANTTYAALSMRDGDGFAKKFGGETGADPDFLSVTFRGYLNDVASADSVTVFLADFRSDDPIQDYILKEWLAVDLTPLGEFNYVQLRFASSDVGDFGINTPTYVCVDQIATTIDGSTGVSLTSAAPAPRVFPSAAKEALYVETDAPVAYAVYDMLGRQTLTGTTARAIDVADLRPGSYAVRFRDSATDAWTAAARFQRVE